MYQPTNHLSLQNCPITNANNIQMQVEQPGAGKCCTTINLLISTSPLRTRSPQTVRFMLLSNFSEQPNSSNAQTRNVNLLFKKVQFFSKTLTIEQILSIHILL